MTDPNSGRAILYQKPIERWTVMEKGLIEIEKTRCQFSDCMGDRAKMPYNQELFYRNLAKKEECLREAMGPLELMRGAGNAHAHSKKDRGTAQQ